MFVAAPMADIGRKEKNRVARFSPAKNSFIASLSPTRSPLIHPFSALNPEPTTSSSISLNMPSNLP